ncbi:isochorismate pyruvate lyase [Pseudomonas sp. SLBN-26]|uniref:chorismate mutase n=1 Tax=Metapseudomonas otitidis TaxID=319939 RepID=A0A679GKF6_9GAMM|nr:MULTISPECIES: chorismate mutase [Pseudomonas]MCP1619744.1 isochorismate pyruvate lyase [Pseudomonas otitidis]MDU9395606.1 chorismate mutase [Pseudomonas sp. zfem003]MWK55661.1 chorismate mutase [Pseudomonas otitidis]TQL08965.1 isochorismate pyruvate lyase [Pseudomonas sp. SLBN-26]WAF85558.1 chorismate mutase [Pseudomonas otitidis]
MVECQSIEQVREQIDALDRRIVQLLAERSGYVRQAARFKTDADAVRAPQRVEQVIAKVRALAAENGAPVEVVEQVYRAMINAFIDAELAEHAALNPSA